MKTFSGLARFTWHQSARQKALCLMLVLGAAMFAAGCGKKSENPPSSAAPPLQTTQDTAQATASATAPVAETSLQELTIDVKRWCVRNHRMPASFEEFSATAGVAIPPPPEGKKYVIGGNMQVQLVNR
ncbi:MAG: hypothetical protein ACLP2Y_03775 [Limisphaerales bacterium]